jgi:hypothetical protein
MKQRNYENFIPKILKLNVYSQVSNTISNKIQIDHFKIINVLTFTYERLSKRRLFNKKS